MIALGHAELGAALPALWADGASVATFMALEPERWVAQHNSHAVRAFFAPLLQGSALESATGSDALPAAGLGSVADLRDALRGIVAAVTRTPADEIMTDLPLRDLGVDSLMTLQIRDRVKQRFGVVPRITDFWSHPTIEAFASHLAAGLSLDDAPDNLTPAQRAESPADDKWAQYL